MASVFSFSQVEIIAFALVLLRVSSFVVAWPVFGTEGIPAPIKILFALAMTMIIFPVVGWNQVRDGLETDVLAWLCVREVFIGLCIGFLARLFFHAVQVAGEIISVSMGLAGAQLFNPSLGGMSTAIEQFYVILATMFFLAINGHHLLISGLVDSFRMVPISETLLSLSQFGGVGAFVQEIVLVGLKISAPVMISVLVMNITMAVIGRAVPQINVLITSLAVNILVGFAVMIITIPLLLWQMNDLLEVTTLRLFSLLKTF